MSGMESAPEGVRKKIGTDKEKDDILKYSDGRFLDFLSAFTARRSFPVRFSFHSASLVLYSSVSSLVALYFYRGKGRGKQRI